MTESVILIKTCAINKLGDTIKLVQYKDMLTDDGRTYSNAITLGVDKHWNKEKLNKLIEDYGCIIPDSPSAGKDIVCKIGKDIKLAVMSMIQAVTVIEAYLCLEDMR